MKYETTPNKIEKIWIDSKNNQVRINRIEGTGLRIKEKISNVGTLSFKRIIELSTDWETSELIPVERYDSTIPGYTSDYYSTWSIVFNSLPIKLIPFINYNVVYKHPDHDPTATPLTDNINNARTTVIFRLENLEDDEDNTEVKKVTMIIGYKLGLVDEDDVYNVQTKLYLNIYNPEFYI